PPHRRCGFRDRRVDRGAHLRHGPAGHAAGGAAQRVLPHHPRSRAAGGGAGEPVDQEASDEGDLMSENPALTAPPDHATTTPVLEVRAITKSFGRVTALRDVTCAVREGEV